MGMRECDPGNDGKFRGDDRGQVAAAEVGRHHRISPGCGLGQCEGEAEAGSSGSRSRKVIGFALARIATSVIGARGSTGGSARER